jgi:hypothetical protein
MDMDNDEYDEYNRMVGYVNLVQAISIYKVLYSGLISQSVFTAIFSHINIDYGMGRLDEHWRKYQDSSPSSFDYGFGSEVVVSMGFNSLKPTFTVYRGNEHRVVDRTELAVPDFAMDVLQRAIAGMGTIKVNYESFQDPVIYMNAIYKIRAIESKVGKLKILAIKAIFADVHDKLQAAGYTPIGATRAFELLPSQNCSIIIPKIGGDSPWKSHHGSNMILSHDGYLAKFVIFPNQLPYIIDDSPLECGLDFKHYGVFSYPQTRLAFENLFTPRYTLLTK